jgi:complex III assembly factor LYRM7
MTSAAVRGAMRRVLRAQRKAFVDDGKMQKLAVEAIREQFRRHEAVPDAAGLDKLLQEAHEAAAFLEGNVVQARLNDRGNYVIDPPPADPKKVEDS